MNQELSIRLAVFKWLAEQMKSFDGPIPWTHLQRGFFFNGTQYPLVSQNGIFKPKVFEYPISITTAKDTHYNDKIGTNDVIVYSYRGINPDHADNRNLRKAMQDHIPLVYFHTAGNGKYFPLWPVYVIGDDPSGLCFSVVADDVSVIQSHEINEGYNVKLDDVRRYYTTQAKQRMHQGIFREQVIDAYKCQCAFCKLKHHELLDAAHIIPDSEPLGKAVVPNGLSLCKLHHAAFDKFFIGVSPDYKILVKHDLLDEVDGPMLQHGIKELHNKKLILPGKKALYPNQEYLEWRFDRFKRSV